MTHEEIAQLLDPHPADVIGIVGLRSDIDELHVALRQLLEERAWQPIETLDLKDRVKVLRPHVIHGVMSVEYYAMGQLQRDGVYAWERFHWFSSGMTTAWPDDAFLPFWMPLPVPPEVKP